MMQYARFIAALTGAGPGLIAPGRRCPSPLASRLRHSADNRKPLRFLSALALLGLSCAPEAAPYSLTLENWQNHPGVREVRDLYQEVNNGLKEGKYRAKERRFDVDAPSCDTYPVKSEMLVLDPHDQPRLYRIERIGSHREPYKVERYYDSQGTLRFVFVDRLISKVRIYLNREGKVFWAVGQSGNQFTRIDAGNEDWEAKPGTAKGAKDEFEGRQPCPEIRISSAKHPGAQDLQGLLGHRVRIRSAALGPGWHEGLFNRQRREPACYVVIVWKPRPLANSAIQAQSIVELEAVSELQAYSGPRTPMSAWAGRKSGELADDSRWRPIPRAVLDRNKDCPAASSSK